MLLPGLWGGNPWGVPQNLQEDVLPLDVYVTPLVLFPWTATLEESLIWWMEWLTFDGFMCKHVSLNSKLIQFNNSASTTGFLCSPQRHSLPQRAGLPGLLHCRLSVRCWLWSVHPLVYRLHPRVLHLLVQACLQGVQVHRFTDISLTGNCSSMFITFRTACSCFIQAAKVEPRWWSLCRKVLDVLLTHLWVISVT